MSHVQKVFHILQVHFQYIKWFFILKVPQNSKTLLGGMDATVSSISKSGRYKKCAIVSHYFVYQPTNRVLVLNSLAHITASNAIHHVHSLSYRQPFPKNRVRLLAADVFECVGLIKGICTLAEAIYNDFRPMLYFDL